MATVNLATTNSQCATNGTGTNLSLNVVLSPPLTVGITFSISYHGTWGTYIYNGTATWTVTGTFTLNKTVDYNGTIKFNPTWSLASATTALNSCANTNAEIETGCYTENQTAITNYTNGLQSTILPSIASLFNQMYLDSAK